MTISARALLVRTVLLPLALVACGGDKSTGPTTGGLVLGVSGLPSGSPADIVVSGPAEFAASVLGTDTLTALAPGEYTVEARRVVHAGDEYVAARERQTVTVRAAEEPQGTGVAYGIATGRLTVSITGLPVSPGTAITVTGPNSYSKTLAGPTQLTRLVPGSYTISSSSVSSGMQVYVADAAERVVSVAASATPVVVNLAFSPTTGLNLVIDGMHITQSVQRYDGSVPLVQGRDGFLRIFGRANVSNSAVPPVRVRLFMNGAQVSEVMIPAGSASVPQEIDQGYLGTSWNLPIDGSLIAPGLSVLAEIDPGNIVGEVSETDNRFPVSGTPKVMNVVSPPVFAIRFVPIRSDSTGLTGNVTEANKHAFMTVANKIHPIAGYDADVRATPYTTSQPPLQSSNGNGAWGRVLSEINALRIAEGTDRYYYGVVGTTYSSGVAGIGYVPGRASLGWDKLPSGAGVLAHEIGHNWGRSHAPCGGVANPDPSYPHQGGLIGAYGFDVATGTVQNPATQSDIMGYCSKQWISDYTYLGILNHRGALASGTGSAGQSEAVVTGAVEPSLLVWGRIEQGKVVLEPAFEIVTRTVTPARGGPYTVEGVDASGARLFSLSFSGDEVADSETGERQFAFAVPLGGDAMRRLTTVRAVGQGGGSAQRTGAQVGEAAPTAEAFAGDRVRIRWDDSRHPMLLVRDAGTGEVLSFARGGEVTVKTRDRELELVVSRGARSNTHRTRVDPQ